MLLDLSVFLVSGGDNVVSCPCCVFVAILGGCWAHVPFGATLLDLGCHTSLANPPSRNRCFHTGFVGPILAKLKTHTREYACLRFPSYKFRRGLYWAMLGLFWVIWRWCWANSSPCFILKGLEPLPNQTLPTPFLLGSMGSPNPSLCFFWRLAALPTISKVCWACVGPQRWGKASP